MCSTRATCDVHAKHKGHPGLWGGEAGSDGRGTPWRCRSADRHSSWAAAMRWRTAAEWYAAAATLRGRGGATYYYLLRLTTYLLLTTHC